MENDSINFYDLNISKNEISLIHNNNETIIYKINAENHPYIFYGLSELTHYITKKSLKENEFFVFILHKNNYKIIIKMRNIKNILNYILSYHIFLELI
jgi:hypothetical protein